MKKMSVRNALVGVVLALVAAYLYIVALSVYIEGPRGVTVFFSILPLIGLLYTFWLVIPLGIALGLLIPQLAYGKTRGMAALYGAVPGAVAGAVSILCLDSVYNARLSTDPVAAASVVYCAMWTSAYACYRAQGQRFYR
jgi:hypothetical protein